jgi:hypothetical protein
MATRESKTVNLDDENIQIGIIVIDLNTVRKLR